MPKEWDGGGAPAGGTAGTGSGTAIRARIPELVRDLRAAGWIAAARDDQIQRVTEAAVRDSARRYVPATEFTIPVRRW